MKRSTTPTHKFIFPYDFQGFVEKLVVTYSQNHNIVLEKTKSDVKVLADGKSIEYTLTQEETNLFREGIVEIEVKVKTFGNNVMVSQRFFKSVEDVLNDKVL